MADRTGSDQDPLERFSHLDSPPTGRPMPLESGVEVVGGPTSSRVPRPERGSTDSD